MPISVVFCSCGGDQSRSFWCHPIRQCYNPGKLHSFLDILCSFGLNYLSTGLLMGVIQPQFWRFSFDGATSTGIWEPKSGKKNHPHHRVHLQFSWRMQKHWREVSLCQYVIIGNKWLYNFSHEHIHERMVSKLRDLYLFRNNGKRTKYWRYHFSIKSQMHDRIIWIRREYTDNWCCLRINWESSKSKCVFVPLVGLDVCIFYSLTFNVFNIQILQI